MQDAAEFGRIGKYYAVESMLVWDPVKQVRCVCVCVCVCGTHRPVPPCTRMPAHLPIHNQAHCMYTRTRCTLLLYADY